MDDADSQPTSGIIDKKSEKPIYYVEIQLKQNSNITHNKLEAHLQRLFRENNRNVAQFEHDAELRENVQSINIVQDDDQEAMVNYQDVNIQYCVYHLNYEEPGTEMLDDQADMAAATHWILPSAHLVGLWENLIYDCNIKSQLLNFASTTLLFSDQKVDSNIITWNKVILLHGPPGTGKTSLCKALAQKLSIRFNSRYLYGQLIEINSHSLFSKWFSESGKLVSKMFQKIQEFIDDPQTLVLVLIDEVESLAHARKTVMSGNEPSDAIRVVNAVLTQLDAIKKYPNVLILTTSNVTGAIDLALVDRADIKQYIGLPSPSAIYKIYQSCTFELVRVGILHTKEVNFWKHQCTSQLMEIAEKSVGLSGRTLRKIPFLAHALYLQKSVVDMPEYLLALSKAVDKKFEEMKELNCQE